MNVTRDRTSTDVLTSMNTRRYGTPRTSSHRQYRIKLEIKGVVEDVDPVHGDCNVRELFYPNKIVPGLHA